MTVWRRIAGWWATHVTRTRTFDSAPRPIDQMIRYMKAAAGRAGRPEALSVPPILRGRNLICSIATLPLQLHSPDLRVVRSPLLTQIDPDIANVVTMAMTVEDLLFDAVAWWQVTARNAEGYPVGARHVSSGLVSLEPPAGFAARVSPLPGEYDPRQAAVWVDGVEVPARDMIRFDSPNPGVLKVCGRTVRKVILLDKLSEMYADDPRPLDYFTPAEGAEEIEDSEVEEILSGWRAARKARSTAWVPAAMNYNTVDAPSPADLQLVELQRQAGLEVANMLGLDPEDLGVSTTSRTYANAVDRRRDRINDVLSPYMTAITDRLSMGDVTPRYWSVKFDLDDYMKSNPTERAAVQKTYLDMGVKTRDEIRAEENLAPLPPDAEIPSNVTPLRPRTDTPAAAASAGRPVAARFDAGRTFTAPMPMRQFKVDRASRTIEGVALPYGKIATKGYDRYRFLPGALQWAEDVGRVKLLRDHDYQLAIGRAVELKNDDQEFRVRFAVARGADGDAALSLAEDGVLDGLSVGVDFDMTADVTVDPDDASVVLVRRADLREVSLTAMPAFDDARVTAVAASQTGGNQPMDPCTTCGQRHAPGVACTPTPAPPAATPPAAPPAPVFDAAAFAAFAAWQQQQQAPPAPEPAGPQFVNPFRQTALTRVNDPAPYRFDRNGNLRPAAHEFSADIIAAFRDGDTAAHERVMAFVRQQFDVATGDVNELNPVRNRPELYVDQRTYRYPVWEAINKGTLTDITAFTFPKFNSAASLVGNHTEGVEPSSGTLTTTAQTVTPTAVSGKAKITRETWDQGGNPQIGNLIWQQMLKGWYEALEAAAVAVLDAASPTQIDFSGTPGLANDDLDQALTSALAGLQFIRGGFTMDNAFTQIDLFKALVAATDADGRRLYPALGPTNANGTVRGRWSGVDVNGVAFLPAWALAATGSVAASSYLFDSDSVHGWASAPQRLTIDQTEVAHVYIGIWGYKATAISDINGVREIVYDPA